ncbi:MAG: 50S ribosomal protein L3 [Candidatus Gracilibacteria bacterium]|nr:50S ribosomal protein L3 [Candidatus Gracilibacteria bacterium]
MAGLLAKKLEMTRVVKDEKFIPVTLLEIPAIKVVGFKTIEKDGYSALIIGITENNEAVLKDGKATLSKNDFSTIKEFPVTQGDLEKYKVGDDLNIDALEGIETVTLVGFSKGKGFAGAMKKHNFHGGPAGHGSKFHRALGSIGNRKPTRTHKGKKMHGHMGDVKVNLKNIPVEFVNKEMNVIGVRGGVPGGRNSMVSIIF